MGTTLGDATYAGLAHAAAPVSAKQLRAIEARWLEWEPFAILAARAKPDFAIALLTFKAMHRARVLHLLTSQIKWKTIRLHRLDCPTYSPGEFEAKLHLVKRRKLRRKF